MQPESQCVHSGAHSNKSVRGANTPIFTSTALEYLDESEVFYPRHFNAPNQEAVVRKLCELEGAEDGMITSSGMAAISTVLLTLLGPGDHAVIQEEVYGGTYDLVHQQLRRIGVDVDLVPGNADAIIEAMGPDTKAVYIETPSNPLVSIVDIRAVAQAAEELGAISIIDSTFASPILQNPLNLGIDVVIHSGTKYLGGHSDIICGAILTSQPLADRFRKTGITLGGNLNAQTCYLLERSLKTLAIRVERQTENAGRIAEFLSDHSAVSKVLYPGLDSHPGHQIARSQMKGYGAMLAFEIVPARQSAEEFQRRLRLIRPTVSLGGVESIICSPALTSHKRLTPEDRMRLGIGDNLLRLSVGIEHIDDLNHDLAQALS